MHFFIFGEKLKCNKNPAETDRGAAPLHVAPLRGLCKEQRKEGKPVKQERKGENICIQIK